MEIPKDSIQWQHLCTKPCLSNGWLYSEGQYSAVQNSAVQYSLVQYSAVQNSAVQCSPDGPILPSAVIDITSGKC